MMGSQMNENAHWLLLYYGICYKSAAIFNPSIVEDFDQSNLERGRETVIISFRATGRSYLINRF
jgi:hypothetical protein